MKFTKMQYVHYEYVRNNEKRCNERIVTILSKYKKRLRRSLKNYVWGNFIDGDRTTVSQITRDLIFEALSIMINNYEWIATDVIDLYYIRNKDMLKKWMRITREEE